ncbi:uncharacterized protein DC041_0006520 [Schistosoma bovis]|uniref:FHL1/2/3/5 N-terminal LIM domain-containing protein n=1 Tax=Schistosoma bovis TaxID=6184 RepID=A0A430QSA0_SCHBO|nr:uncharacterized protein DC041_0006520 [Schistosoma bovis]
MSDEVIVNANEQFNCSNCNLSLIGQKYILNDEKPYCVACYESKFSHTCELCKEKITCDSKLIQNVSHYRIYKRKKPLKCTEYSIYTSFYFESNLQYSTSTLYKINS